MRCKACNNRLGDHESRKKDTHGEFLDLCTICIRAGCEFDDENVDDCLVRDMPELFFRNTQGMEDSF